MKSTGRRVLPVAGPAADDGAVLEEQRLREAEKGAELQLQVPFLKI